MKTGATKNPTLNCEVAVHSKHQNKQEVKRARRMGYIPVVYRIAGVMENC
jgi:hypothetical protein